jgi:hypothetical protein
MVKNRSPISVNNLGYFCPMQVFYISPQSAVSKHGLLWVFFKSSIVVCCRCFGLSN